MDELTKTFTNMQQQAGAALEQAKALLIQRDEIIQEQQARIAELEAQVEVC
jgi:hypothetical protein